MRFPLGSSLVFLLLTALPAHAQTDIGTRLQQFGQDVWQPFFFLISCASFLAGLGLLGMGLLRLARQHETREGLWRSGLAHILAATLLMSLPDAAGIGVATVFGQNSQAALGLAGSGIDDDGNSLFGGDGIVPDIGSVEVGKTENCLISEAPAACMAKNLAVNAVPMAIWTLFGIAFLMGLISFASAILDITKAQGQGGLPRGWSMKLATSILLMNAASLFTLVSRTILGRDDGPVGDGGLNASSSMLSYQIDTQVAVLQRYAEMIGWCFQILAFFGAWAFVRGIFLMKSSAEGRSEGGFGKAAVFIVAGILLANAKFSTCVLLTTVGGQEMGNGFCN
jgi:hypothetical protein